MTREAIHGHPTPERVLRGSIEPEEVLRRCGRTFHAASRVLPAGVREDLALLYAVCRAIDDAADAGCTVTGRERGGALLDDVSAAVRGEHDRYPLVNAFRSLAARRGIPLALPDLLIDGVRSDLGSVRVSSIDELLRYSYRVASTVGLMMCRVLDVPREGEPFAVDLGIAMQLTNIARDVIDDAHADRVYLPRDWVDASAVLAATGCAGPSSPGDDGVVCEAVVRLLGVAERYYESGELGMQFLPLAVRGGIRAAAWNYRAIGTIIRRDPPSVLAARARTSSVGKLIRTTGAMWAASLESLPLGPAEEHDESLHAAVRGLRVASA